VLCSGDRIGLWVEGKREREDGWMDGWRGERERWLRPTHMDFRSQEVERNLVCQAKLIRS
jgi:hypothetical protein